MEKNQENQTSLLQALLEVQKQVCSVSKNANNPFFKSKYVDYCALQEAVFPVLNGAGILVTQPTVIVDGKNYVKTILTHAASGESAESLTEIIFKPGDAQAQGGGITYARRYGLMSLLALGADDDDANAASGRTVDRQGRNQEQRGASSSHNYAPASKGQEYQQAAPAPAKKPIKKGDLLTKEMLEAGGLNSIVAKLRVAYGTAEYMGKVATVREYYKWDSQETLNKICELASGKANLS